MAGEISNLAGTALAARPAPAAPPAHRAGSRRPVPDADPEKAAALPATDKKGQAGGSPDLSSSLDEMVEKAQNRVLTNSTTLSFERDSLDGKMYICVKDRRTGEDLYRIPRNYLADSEASDTQSHQVDVRI